MSKETPLIHLRDVRKTFSGQEVLHGIDLAVSKGEAVVVIGSSGSGKSTLLRCMNLLEVPTSGSVFFSGIELTATRNRGLLREVRGKLGMVFQSFNLYPHMTALGNVSLALRLVKNMTRKQATDVASEALASVGLHDKLQFYPAQLSGGQKQRVGIARSVALQPEAILFDEPTSALDPELVDEVLDVMVRLRTRGLTMVIASHEMSFAQRIASKIIVMDSGNIVEQGHTDKIFNSPDHERTRILTRSVRK